MTRLDKPDLLNAVVSAIYECGWKVLFIDEHHPFRLHVYNEDESFRIRVYIWNITSGGRNRPANEYRIQVTSVERFAPEPGGKTLILGWWQEAEVFAAFDFKRHRGPLGASPSLQIREETLRQAYTSGFSACLKENQEIAVAFQPSFLVEYLKDQAALHGFGESQDDMAVLDAVASAPDAVNEATLETVSPKRRLVVASVQRRLRSSGFRSRVLTVYGHKCTFCGLQLDLVQAAHIVPVSHEKSIDATYNGITVCFLHHAAYDRGLITFDENYRVITDEEQLDHFKEVGRDGKLDEFVAALRPLIILPPALSDRPHVDFVRLANQIRGWNL